MKEEFEPIALDELVLRLIWGDYFKPDLQLPVQPGAFEPRKSEAGGISVFRMACLQTPKDALKVIAQEKQAKYAIAMLAITDLQVLGLTVRLDPIDAVPGHAVVPELNSKDYKTEKARWRTIQKQLAELASRNVCHRPTA